MKQYKITLNYLKAPQADKNITINGVATNLPISVEVFLKILKAKSPYFSFVSSLESDIAKVKHRQVITLKVKSLRDLSKITLDIKGVNSQFFSFNIEAINE